MAKKKSEVIVSFDDSSSVKQVTGSCVLVNDNILLECGGSQGGNMLENYKWNNSNFKFKTKNIEYLFIMHVHADHILRAPLLFARNCNAKVFIPSGNREIMYKILLNSAMILEGEAKTLTKRSKNGKEFSPIYTREDVETMMRNVYEVDMGVNRILDDNTSFYFINSGHVPNGASIMLTVKGKTIYYTSDLGNSKYQAYYCEDMQIPKNADLVISESTYANKQRSSNNPKQREDDIKRLSSVIEHYDRILIPCFAFHRSQSIMSLLYDMYNDKNLDHEIYVDSILLNDLNKIFEKRFPKFKKVLKWNKIHCITKNERQTLLKSKSKMIIISASGSLVAGASVQWAKEFLPDPKACFVFVGHQFEGSLGYKIKLKDQKSITINGEKVVNKAQVCKLKSFSSHIQYNELVELLKNINSPKIVLHHGNEGDKLNFKKELEKEFEKICKTSRVICPTKSTKIRL